MQSACDDCHLTYQVIVRKHNRNFGVHDNSRTHDSTQFRLRLRLSALYTTSDASSQPLADGTRMVYAFLTHVQAHQSSLMKRAPHYLCIVSNASSIGRSVPGNFVCIFSHAPLSLRGQLYGMGAHAGNEHMLTEPNCMLMKLEMLFPSCSIYIFQLKISMAR